MTTSRFPRSGTSRTRCGAPITCRTMRTGGHRIIRTRATIPSGRRARLCDGCHSVGFNIADNSVAEWNVGCERCHGAGSTHVEHPTRDNILNPARMNYVAANDTCIQCHSQGQPLKNPIEGKYYDWPVGYTVGTKLSDFWKLEEHELGKLTFTHFPDGTGP